MTLEDSGRYTNNRADAYHDSPACRMINRPDEYAQRSVSYIEQRDLRPCSFCHEGIDGPGGDNGADWGPITSLREAARDDRLNP